MNEVQQRGDELAERVVGDVGEVDIGQVRGGE